MNMILALFLLLWILAFIIVLYLLVNDKPSLTFTKNQIKVARERYQRRRANPENFINNYIEL
jgi:uncharacterized membrane protein